MKALLLILAVSVPSLVSLSPTPTGEFVAVRYIDSTFNVLITHDVSYGDVLNLSTNHVDDVQVDIYEPAGDLALSRAAILWVHGGGFTSGDKSEMETMCRYYASRGYVAIAVNYRLVRPAGRQNLGAIYAGADTQAAVRWLRTQAFNLRIDTDKIALCGNSSGGYAVLGAAYDQALEVHNQNLPDIPFDVAACVDISGRLYNLPSMEHGEAPLLINHGMQDLVVPFAYALELETTAISAGVSCETNYYPLEGHTLMRSKCDDIMPVILDFLYRRMIEE
ncbi:MAG: alpha/beta hydrolase [Planctomycetota bacterium]|nr:alpha/beta hydrolase [Planctomycetota bacterium]MDA1112754.1 alpha/beta hydrolase [Planctomycetota bacterium]